MKGILRFSVRLVAVLIAGLCAWILIYCLTNEQEVNSWAIIGLLFSAALIFRPEMLELPQVFKEFVFGRQRSESQHKPAEESTSKKLIEDIVGEKELYKSAFKGSAKIIGEQDRDIQGLKEALGEGTGAIVFWRRQSLINEFRYLNLFYVYNTKRLLAWIVYNKSVSTKEVSDRATSYGIRFDITKVTLEVLKGFDMIRVENNQIHSEPKAEAFLEYINFKFNLLADTISLLSP